MGGGGRGGCGETAGLVALLEEHCEAIEADLAYRGVDVRDLWRGTLTLRRLGVLIEYLPPESATRTAMRDAMSDDERTRLSEGVQPPGYGPWSHTDLLLARVIDVLEFLRYQGLALKGVKAQPPALLPRPGVARPKAPSAAGVAYLTEMRERHRRGA